MPEKLEVAQAWIAQGLKVSVVLRAVGVNRSTYYYRQSHSVRATEPQSACGGRPAPGYSSKTDGELVSDEQIKEWISNLIEGEGYAYGYLKLTKVLPRKYSLAINKKKVYRLCKLMGVLRPQRKLKPRRPRKIARNREITAPNQLLEADVKYGYVHGQKRFFFVVSILDVYDRSAIHSHIGLTATSDQVVAALGHALWKRQLLSSSQKPVIRTDNGPQFTSDTFAAACARYGLEHERIPCATPNLNAHIEAFHRILEDECLGLYEFATFEEAYLEVASFMRFYNEVRIHSAIDYLAPSEFYSKTQSNTAKLPTIRF